MNTERAQARGSISKAEALSEQEILGRSPLADLAVASREALLGLATLSRLPPKHSIAAQGEPPRTFLLVGAGRVKLERLRGERALPLGHRGPGQMVGETALGGSPNATESAWVLDEVQALAIPISALRAQLAADAPLRAAVAAALVQQHRALEQRIEALLLHGVESRLAAFLLDASARWGRLHEGGDVLAASFTHAEIALLIGSTRETVTLILGKLRREGLLAFDRRRIVLRDRAELAQRVSSLAA